MSSPECVACLARWPDPAFRIADLGSTVAYLHDDQFLPGWTLLVLKRHATELYHLSPEERAGLVEEVNAVARALAGAFGARKMNYALLGNQIPHIHWHVVPRRADDPAPQAPPWSVTHAPLRLGAAEREARLALIRQALGR